MEYKTRLYSKTQSCSLFVYPFWKKLCEEKLYGKKSYKIPEFTEASNCVSIVPVNYSDDHFSG